MQDGKDIGVHWDCHLGKSFINCWREFPTEVFKP